MKRDLELIRDILFYIEESEERLILSTTISFPEKTTEEINHQLDLLCDCEYIKATKREYIHGDIAFHIYRMTAKGHDYLDSVRDGEVWNNIKSKFGGSVLGITLDIVAAVGIEFLKNKFGIGI